LKGLFLEEVDPPPGRRDYLGNTNQSVKMCWILGGPNACQEALPKLKVLSSGDAWCRWSYLALKNRGEKGTPVIED